MSSIVVRRATVADADGIAAVHIKAWQETYRHVLPVERLNALVPAERATRWREILAESDEQVWVSELDGEVVGWAITADRELAVHPRSRELNGMYAYARVHGSGVGQALLDAALGDAPAFLWVAADNPRAQAFYRRNGFAPDGEAAEHPLLDTPVAIVRWVR